VIAEAVATQRSRLAVGFQTSIGRGLRPVISPRFQERRPGWSVDFKQVSWSDASAGLLDGSSHVAILWLPVPDSAALSWRVLASEPRWVALSQGTGSPVAGPFPFAELLEEPFLAPPASAGPLRDCWLATEERGERPIRIAAEVSTPDEAFEAVTGRRRRRPALRRQRGHLQAGGRRLQTGRGLSPSQLAVAWRTRDERALVRDFVAACRQAATEQR
jgi:hypothetical protein